MKRLTFQWRVTLLTAALVLIACAVLGFAIGGFAVLHFDEVGNGRIEIAPTEGGLPNLGFDLSQVAPQVTGELAEAKRAFIVQSVFLTVIVALAAIVAAHFLAGRALRPLRDIAGGMGRIHAQNLSRPLTPLDREDELQDLVRSFNGMLARLDESFAAQRRFSASAAHELRTPLAVMRTRLELLRRTGDATRLDEATGAVIEQVDRLSRLVELLLEMTELQTVERSDRVELSALVDEVLCDLAETAEQNGVLLMQAPGECEVMGSDSLLYRAISNLVENAVRHGGPGGTVRVEVTCTPSQAVVSVSDTGDGIDPEIWDAVFSPFFRGPAASADRVRGTGLGLALVQEIARVHAGSARIAASSPEGTTVELVLPREPASRAISC